MCTIRVKYPQRPEEGIRSPGAGVTVVSHNVDTGIEPKSFGRAASVPNHQVISSAPFHEIAQASLELWILLP